MKQTGEPSDSNGAYDPQKFSRGAVINTERVDPDSDSSGRQSKQLTFTVRLHLEDGIHAPPLSTYIGAIYMDNDETLIEIPFAGRMRNKEGDWEDGDWIARVTGKRLGSLLDHIAEGRRLSIKRTGRVDDPKRPQVDDVKVKAMT